MFRSHSLPWQWSIHDRRISIQHQAWMRREASLAALRQFSMQCPGSGVPRVYLLSNPVNRHALVSCATLPHRSGSPLGSPWLAHNEKNRAGKRYQERRKEKPKAVA